MIHLVPDADVSTGSNRWCIKKGQTESQDLCKYTVHYTAKKKKRGMLLSYRAMEEDGRKNCSNNNNTTSYSNSD